MKQLFAIPYLFISILLGCNSNNANLNEETPVESSKTENIPASSIPASSGDGIVGEWQLVMQITDRNDNDQIDEEEKKEAVTQAEDYMKLNSDGTAEYTVYKGKGTYEVVTDNPSGHKYLVIIAGDGTKIKKGRILSLTSTELILIKKEAGTTGFYVFKRI